MSKTSTEENLDAKLYKSLKGEVSRVIGLANTEMNKNHKDFGDIGPFDFKVPKPTRRRIRETSEINEVSLRHVKDRFAAYVDNSLVKEGNTDFHVSYGRWDYIKFELRTPVMIMSEGSSKEAMATL